MYGSYPKALRFDPANNDASLATAMQLERGYRRQVHLVGKGADYCDPLWYSGH